jgi:hypothetical protein
VSAVDVRHGRHHAGFPDVAGCRIEDDPDAQPIIARLGAAVDPDYPNRMVHVLRVAAIVIQAKRNPTNAYAKATLA